MNEILNAALEYAARGWSVIPISKEKRPCIKWQDATREQLTNPDNIRKWWERYPGANVAIVTGSRSGGLVVVDLDIDEDKGINGVDSLNEWCDANGIYEIESEAAVTTGRGGRHLYFQSGDVFHNQVDCLKGVDIRGEGGCIVAPPSVHKNGRMYTWDADEDVIIVPKADSDVTFFLASMEHDAKPQGEYKKNNFDEPVTEGGRNSQLFKYLSKLQGEGLPDDEIRERAIAHNQMLFIPPLPADEVERTVQSVLGHKEWKGTSIKETTEPVKKQKRPIRRLKTAEELMQKDIPEPKVFIGVGDDLPLLVEGTCILSAKPKLGKSWFALAMCIAVANGEDFLGYKTHRCSTLYLDLETGEALQQRRLKRFLHGKPAPKNFYLDTETDTLENGFADQIENYLEQDPNIGIVVIDVFQLIRTGAKPQKETEYEHAYRDIKPLNELAQKYHISIILVCHDRKAVDPDDPFSNILGSTGLQGAASQMIVMFRRKKDDPIHISIKGKTIDGLPELNVKLEDAAWYVVEGETSADRMHAEQMREYKLSNIRAAVLKIVEVDDGWHGRCTHLIDKAIELGVPVTEDAQEVGFFFRKHIGRFLGVDGILIEKIKNGNAPLIYRLRKKPLITIDGTIDKTESEFVSAEEYRGSDIPF